MICLFKRNTNFVRISGSGIIKYNRELEVFTNNRVSVRQRSSRNTIRILEISRILIFTCHVILSRTRADPIWPEPNRTEPSIGYPRFSDSRTPLVSSEAIELENLESRRFSPVRYDINRSTGNWVRPAEWRRRFLRSMYCERSV